jgi:hypothetical protein
MKTTTLFIAAMFCLQAFAQTTLTLKPGATEGKDVVLPWHSPNDNHATNTSLHVTAWTYSGNQTTTRVLLDFDLSAIPAGAVVNSATLNLFYNPTSGFNNEQQSGANEGAIYRITNSWSENTVTWNNQPAYTTAGAVSYPASVNYDDDLTADVTQLIQLYVDSPSISHGFLLKLNDEQSYRARMFASSDHATSALHPELIVTYTATGIEELDNNYFSIYPNPSANKIKITSILHNADNVQYEIIDALGATAMASKATAKDFSIDVSTLPAGIYFIHLQSGNAQTVKRFVKE